MTIFVVSLAALAVGWRSCELLAVLKLPGASRDSEAAAGVGGGKGRNPGPFRVRPLVGREHV